MTAFWGSSYGFPKPLPTAPFKEYIKDNEIEACHYYSAYPEATITMVQASLELDVKLAPLKRNAAQDGPRRVRRRIQEAAHRRPALPMTVSRTSPARRTRFLAMTPIMPGEEEALRAYLDGLRDRGPSAAREASAHAHGRAS